MYTSLDHNDICGWLILNRRTTFTLM